MGRESNPPGDWNGGASLYPVWQASVVAGKTLEYVIGGPGRPVTGKVTGFDNWKNVTVSITKALNYPWFGRRRVDPKDSTWPAFNAYMDSPAYKFFNKDVVNITENGTFRVENVAAESYIVTVTEKTGDQETKSGQQRLTVGPMPDGKSSSSRDVGTIKMDPVTRSKKVNKSEAASVDTEAKPKKTVKE